MFNSNIRLATLVRVLVLAAFLVTAIQFPALAVRRDFTFVNHSGLTILQLYVSRTGYDSWGSDLLGSSMLESGESVNLWYDDYYTNFDVKVVFTGSTPDAIFSSHSFNSLWRLTIYRRDGRFWITSN